MSNNNKLFLEKKVLQKNKESSVFKEVPKETLQKVKGKKELLSEVQKPLKESSKVKKLPPEVSKTFKKLNLNYKDPTRVNRLKHIKFFKQFVVNPEYALPEDWTNVLKNNINRLRDNKDDKNLFKDLARVESLFSSVRSKKRVKYFIKYYELQTSMLPDMELDVKHEATKYGDYHTFSLPIENSEVFANLDYRFLVVKFYKDFEKFIKSNGYKRLIVLTVDDKGLYTSSLTNYKEKLPSLEEVLFNLNVADQYDEITAGNVKIIFSIKTDHKKGNGEQKNMILEDFGIKNGVYFVPSDKYCGQMCMYIATAPKRSVARFLTKPLNEQIKVLKRNNINLDCESMSPQDFPPEFTILELFLEKSSTKNPSLNLNSLKNPVVQCLKKGLKIDLKDNNLGKVHKENLGFPYPLVLYKQHYYVISSPDKFFKKLNFVFCEDCDSYQKKNHFCHKLICECGKSYKMITAFNKHRQNYNKHNCETCNVILYYDKCDNTHKCTKLKTFCNFCHIYINKNRYEEHVRNGHNREIRCGNCNVFDNINYHRCFLTKGRNLKNYDYYAYDIECYAKEVNGFIEQKFALLCLREIRKPRFLKELSPKVPNYDPSSSFLKNNDSNLDPVFCGGKVFKENLGFPYVMTKIEELIDWINSVPRPTILFAHNGGKYDNIIIREALIRKKIIPKYIVQKGFKIIQFKIGKVIFRDSIGHLSMSLNDVALSFKENLGSPSTSPKDVKENNNFISVGRVLESSEGTLLKGNSVSLKSLFPYRFFTEENKDYKGEVDIKYFNKKDQIELKKLKEESPEQYEEFQDQFRNNTLFNVCIEYCKNDVDILVNGLEKYRETMMYAAEIDPLQYITKASYAMSLYRKKFMPKDSISYLQPNIANFIRRGFGGGRTNCIVKYYKGRFQSKDVSSMYPAVQKYDLLPGHLIEFKYSLKPTFQNDPFPQHCERKILEDYENNIVGFYECDIICPKKLFHPVLGRKQNGKYIFSLEDIKKEVYYSSELVLAMKYGYKITNIYSFAIFEGTTKLFSEFIDKFYNIKSSINKKEKPALYTSMKILLNSLWGKFGEDASLDVIDVLGDDDDKRYAKLIQDELNKKIEYKSHTLIRETEFPFNKVPSELSKTLPQKDLKISEKIKGNFWGRRGVSNPPTVFLIYKFKKAFTSYIQTKGSIAVAAAITSCARIRLYEGLAYYNERVLYFDTDSIYFKGDLKNPPLPQKNPPSKLGSWEIEVKNGSEFVSLGPKMYAFKENSRNSKEFPLKEEVHKSTVHAKGIPEGEIKFEAMKQLIDLELGDPSLNKNDLNFNKLEGDSENMDFPKENPKLEVTLTNFKRSNTDVKIQTDYKKIIRVTCDKRVYLNNDISVPFGYEAF